MTAHDRQLEQRAGTLAVRQLSGRTFEVESASGGKPHIVRGAADQAIGTWTCDCRGATGKSVRGADGVLYRPMCSHKRAVARKLLVTDRPVPASRTAPRRKPVSTDVPIADPIVFRASIPPIQSAVKVAGDGGVRLTIDVADSDYEAVMDFVRQARGRSFRLVPVWDVQQQEEDPRA